MSATLLEAVYGAQRATGALLRGRVPLPVVLAARVAAGMLGGAWWLAGRRRRGHGRFALAGELGLPVGMEAYFDTSPIVRGAPGTVARGRTPTSSHPKPDRAAVGQPSRPAHRRGIGGLSR